MDSIRLVVIRKPDNSKHDAFGEEEVDVDIGKKNVLAFTALEGRRQGETVGSKNVVSL